jgi:hypothetical protein
MRQCLGCKGLVPSGVDDCPNCAATRARLGTGKALLAAAGLVAIGVSGCICQAVYGPPCTAKSVDGGTTDCTDTCDLPLPDGGNPTADPDNSCFIGTDAGTP